MNVPFVFAVRVVLVGLKVPFDRLRPDDSILALVRIFGRFITRSSGMPRLSRLEQGPVKKGRCGEISFPESTFLLSSRLKRSYHTIPIRPSAHLNSSIIRPVITTVLTTMSRSRTVNMQ